ncbi:MAG: hypothetical protein VXY42_00280 [Candidatus Thermoplasmatota archaeon]|nr:hypothetical protein [Candidatus Thermoplasmatota archaeon]
MVSPMVDHSEELTNFDVSNSTPLGQAMTVSIGSYPDGVNDATTITVPSGEAVSGIELSLDESVLPVSAAKVFDSSADYDDPLAVYDGMDVNNSVLQILPQGWTYDFEGPNTGPNNWTLGSNWFFGKDTASSRPSTSTVPSGINTLYSYNGDYPNRMSSTLWATSPVMNCGGCSGGWDLKFQRQLGVESSSFDHAYVSVTNPSGNWVNVYSNSGTVSDSSFTPQTITITNYVAGNTNFQVRFGIGTTDGSVTYSGWNVDDVEILPKASGVSNGEGNWTSQPFGPGATLGSEPSSFGLMVIDAEIPTGSLFEWSLIDASTGTPLPNYQEMNDLTVDLGAIDWEETPSLRLKIHMVTGSNGGPKVHSIGISGAIHESFSENPTTHDWSLSGMTWTQSSGDVSGSGTMTSPIYRISNGFGALSMASVVSGSPLFEANIDDKGWLPYPADGYTSLDEVGHSIQFRFQSSGTSYTVDSFSVETVRSNPSMGLRLDVGADGVSDWGFDTDDVGSFGMQNRLLNGKVCQTVTTSPGNGGVFDVLLPISGLADFGFTVSSTSEMISPYMNIKIGGSDVTNRGFANFQTATYVEFSQSELNALNSALSNAADDRGILGVPMSRVSVTVGSSTSSGDLTMCGIFAPYEAALNLNFGANSALVQAINQELSTVVSLGGVKEIRFPVRMMSSGSILLTVEGVTSLPTLNPVSITVSPAVDTLTPSTDWITVNSTFDLSPLGVTDAESYVKSNGWSVDFTLRGTSSSSKVLCGTVTLPLNGVEVANCQRSGFALGWNDIDTSGEIKMIGSGSYVQFTHTFQMPVSWDDEPYASLNVMLVSPTGPTLPLNYVFGLGQANGIENDVSLKRFTITAQSGIETDASEASLIQGTTVSVNAYLGFDGVKDAVPRTGQAEVRLLVDGQNKGSTNLILNGVASLTYSVPSNANNLQMELEITPLVGQGIAYEVDSIANFTMDSIAPMLIGMNVETFDHREGSPSTELKFVLGDSPSLPHHADANVWRSWVDDSDMDGIMDEDEVQVLPLKKPDDMLSTVGEFTLTMDTSQAPDGDYIQGWLSVSDGAGNVMVEGGSQSTPLFNIQIRQDGTPSLGTDFDLIWGQNGDGWLHPGEDILIQIPIRDSNGVSDIESIEVNLGSTESNAAIIYWFAENNQCYSNQIYIDVESCDLEKGEGVFSEQGALLVNFSIGWGFDPDPNFVRTPSVQLVDRVGQTVVTPLYDATWQYSGEITLDMSQSKLLIDSSEVNSHGAYASDVSVMEFQGELVWYRSMRTIDQPFDLLFEINEEESVVEAYGNFSFQRTVPEQSGEHGLFFSMYNPPTGAILRGLSEGPITTIFVDKQAPDLVDIRSPEEEMIIAESDWSDLEIQLTVKELEQLNPDSLVLNYAVHPAGLGMNVAALYDGQINMQLLGGRAFGEQVPIAATLNLDEIISESDRTDALELRIWVTGEDMAGNAFSEDYNDADAAFHTWDLEQRVPDFTFAGEPMVKYSGDSVRIGETVEVSALIINNGNADGDVQIVLELVESNGARTRVDARQLQISPGSTTVYEGTWTPSRTGTMWLEVQILGSETVQTPTLRVKEAESEGFVGTVSEVNPVVLGVLVVLSIVLVGLLVFGLRPAQQPQRRVNPNLAQQMNRPRQMQPPAAQQTPQGPYGAQQQTSDVGQNPYQ